MVATYWRSFTSTGTGVGSGVGVGVGVGVGTGVGASVGSGVNRGAAVACGASVLLTMGPDAEVSVGIYAIGPPVSFPPQPTSRSNRQNRMHSFFMILLYHILRPLTTGKNAHLKGIIDGGEKEWYPL